MRAGLNGFSVIDHSRAGAQQSQVAVHSVLIQRNQKVNFVTEAGHSLRTGADSQKCMSAPDNGLICIVGVEVQAAPGKNTGEDIARSRDSLSRGAPDGYREGMFHASSLRSSRDRIAVMMPRLHDRRPMVKPPDRTQPGIGGRTYRGTAASEQG